MNIFNDIYQEYEVVQKFNTEYLGQQLATRKK